MVPWGAKSGVRVPASLVVRLDGRVPAALDARSGDRVGRPSGRSLFHFDLRRLWTLALLLGMAALERLLYH